jgi:DNA-binding NtrC family response regulator
MRTEERSREGGLSDPPADPAEKTDPALGCRILVVDDDANIRRLVTVILEREGHAPVAVATVAQARAHRTESVDPESVDLIVSDLHLADGNGFELLAKYAFQPATKFVMISGDRNPAVAEQVEAVGGTFLPKPFSQEQLLRAVRGALARP